MSYLFLVSRADEEAGHNDGCSWHQVELSVGGPIVTGPANVQGEEEIDKSAI